MIGVVVCAASRSAEPQSSSPTATDDAIYRALTRKITASFVEAPLNDVVDYLRRSCGLNVVLDRRALKQAGISPEAPLTFAVGGVSLRSVLDVFRRAYRLDWTIRGDVLLITTWARARQLVYEREYNIDDLIAQPDGSARVWRQAERLEQMIRRLAGPGTWRENGIAGTVSVVPVAGRMRLFVKQNRHVHRQVEQLPAVLRRASKPTADGSESGGASLGAIEEALSSTVSVDFRDKPLADALRSLRRQCGVNILLDERALSNAQVVYDRPITVRLSDVTLRFALRSMLEPEKLTFVAEDELLLVTTWHESVNCLYRLVRGHGKLRVYPVADLAEGYHDFSRETSGVEALEQAIRSICPSSWDGGMDEGQIWHNPLEGVDGFAVQQDVDTHDEIAALLGDLRRLLADASADRLENHYGGTSRRDPSPEDAAVFDVLKRPVTFAFDDAPMRQVARSLGEVAGVNVLPDEMALFWHDETSSTKISFAADDVPLRSALNGMLRRHDMTYFVRRGVLWITTRDEMETRLSLRWYPVGDLVARTDPASLTANDFEPLIEMINQFDERYWGSAGGVREVSAVVCRGVPLLLVRQTPARHEEIAWALRTMREIARDAASGALKPCYGEWVGENPYPGEAAVCDALDRPVTLDFDGQTFKQVAGTLSEMCGVEVCVDERAFDECGIDSGATVRFAVKEISLRSALQHLLRLHDLEYLVIDDVLLITTPSTAGEEGYTVRWYPIGDLTLRTDLLEATKYHFHSLEAVITSNVAPMTWEDVGGAGSISVPTTGGVPTLMVYQTPSVHEEIAGLLAGLRRIAAESNAGRLPAGAVFPHESTSRGRNERAIREALDRKIDVDFRRTPLTKVATTLRQKAGINVLIDRRAMVEVGMSPDVTVTLSAQGILLRAALRLMLRPLDLTHVIVDEVLSITTPEEAESLVPLGLYPIGDLATDVERPGETDPFDLPMKLLVQCVAPMTWGDVGGAGSVGEIECQGARVLVVSQTQDVHEELIDLLGMFREAASRPEAGGVVAWDARIPPEERAVRKALQQEVSFWYAETPLSQLVQHLSADAGVNVVINHRALREVGMTAHFSVSVDAKNVTLETALRQVLRPIDLTFLIRDEVVVVTTPEEREAALLTRVYPVGDLIEDDLPEGATPETLSPELLRPRLAPLCTLDLLEEIVQGAVAPITWDIAGGAGAIHAGRFGDLHALVVRQRTDAHDEVASLLALLRRVAQDTAAGNPAAQYVDRLPADQTVYRALERDVAVDFQQTPLADVVRRLGESCDVRIELDTEMLHVVGVDSKTPISGSAENLTLREALCFLLRGPRLTFVVEEGVLLITPIEEAYQRLTLAIYPVGDLLDTGEGTEWKLGQLRRLESLVSDCTIPACWDERGGAGDVAAAEFENVTALVVSQTDDMHRDIAMLLDGLRRAVRQASERSFTDTITCGQRPENVAAEKAIGEALRRQVSWEFHAVPLSDVLSRLRETTGIEVTLDDPALAEADVDLDTPVTLDLKDVRLDAALALALRQFDLGWNVERGALQITPTDWVRPVTKLYAVGDLVTCRDPSGEMWDDYRSLIDAVYATTSEALNREDLTGAAGISIGPAKMLAVTHTAAFHHRFARKLARIRSEAAESPGAGSPPVRPRRPAKVPPVIPPFLDPGPPQ